MVLKYTVRAHFLWMTVLIFYLILWNFVHSSQNYMEILEHQIRGKTSLSKNNFGKLDYN